MKLFDTHTHLDQPEFDADRAEVIARAHQSGVETILAVGVDLPSSRAAVRLAEQFPGVYAAVGVQPNHCAAVADGDWEQIVALARHPRVVAIGETGLDCYWDYAPLELQRTFFGKHIQLSAQCGLPLVIHCRDAQPQVLEMLGSAAASGPLRGVVHAFSGDASFAQQCVAMGLHISFAGSVSFTNKKFAELRQAAAAVPDDRILLETDSPYMVPHPLRGKQQRNEPSLLVYTAQALAALRGTAPEQLAAQSTANARRLFGLY